MIRFIIYAIFLFTLGTSAVAQTTFTAEPPQGLPRCVQPGEVVTLVFKLHNHTDKKITLQPEVELPENWNIVSAVAAFTLSAQTKDLKIFSFQISKYAIADTFNISYSIYNQKEPSERWHTHLPVIVKEVHELQLEPLSAPEFVLAGEPFQVEYILKNLGNTPQSIRLSAKNGTISGEREITLPPGASRHVLVESATDENISKINRFGIRLIAENQGATPGTSTSFQSVRVIPLVERYKEDRRSMPLTLGLSYIGQSSGRQPYDGSFQASLYTQGKLDKAGHHFLEVKLRGPDNFDNTRFGQFAEYFLNYQYKNHRLFLGDKVYSLSPLTELARFGRGIEASTSVRNFAVGGYYMRPRFYPEVEEVGAGFLGYHFKNKNLIRLNGIRQKFTQSPVPSYTVSATGKLFSIKNTSAVFELAKGVSEGNSGYGGYLNLSTKPIPRLTATGSVFYGSEEFRGFISNGLNLSFSANYLLGKKLRFNTTYFQDKQNLSRDTIYSAAPLSHQFLSGFQYIFSQNSRLHLQARWGEMEDVLPEKKFHFMDRSLRLQWLKNFSGLQFSFMNAFGTRQHLLESANQEAVLTYRSNLDITYSITPRHLLRGFIFLTNDNLQIASNNQWIYGLSADLQLLPATRLSFFLQSNYLVEEYYRNRSLFEGHLVQELPGSQEISLVGRYSLLQRTIDQKDFALMVSYNKKLNIPLEKSNGYQDIHGQIINRGVDRVEGIILMLNGHTAVTDAHGRFSFKNIAPGEHYLLIDPTSTGTLDLPDEPFPKLLKMTPDVPLEVSFGLTRGVAITGSIGLEEDPDYFKNQENKEFCQVIIELASENEVIRQFSDQFCQFKFSGLRPGKWTLKIIPVHLPANKELEKKHFEYELEAGDEAVVRVSVREKKKQIKIQKSFQLKN